VQQIGLLPMQQISPSNLESEEVHLLIHRDLSIVTRGSVLLLSHSLADIGLTAPEFFLLLYLYEQGQPRQEDLVEYFMLDKGAIARTLQKLENKELIIRTVDEKDQRKKFIQLSPKGYSLKTVCSNLLCTWHETLLKNISEQDIEVFERVLKTMALNVTSNLENEES